MSSTCNHNDSVCQLGCSKLETFSPAQHGHTRLPISAVLGVASISLPKAMANKRYQSASNFDPFIPSDIVRLLSILFKTRLQVFEQYVWASCLSNMDRTVYYSFHSNVCYDHLLPWMISSHRLAELQDSSHGLKQSPAVRLMFFSGKFFLT